MTPNYRVFAGDLWLEKTLTLKEKEYRVVGEDGAGLGLMAFARPGRKAKVYKLKSSHGYSALKVFFKKYAIFENLFSTLQLGAFASVPGLTVCRRQVVDENEGSGVDEPGLAFAILMPWIDGTAWAEIIASKQDLGEPKCIALARVTAAVLNGLEQRQLAHADISSSNVIVQIDRDPPGVELIDVEDMYHPRFFQVRFPPDGSPGYTHPGNQGKGCCNEYGDRFASAVLLAEILTWHQPRLREKADDGYFFTPDELCKPGPKYDLVLDALSAHSSDVPAYFEQAWYSDGLADCPTLASWQASLNEVHRATKRIGQPKFFLGLGPTPSYFNLLSGGAFQTKIAPSTVCSECGNRVKASTPQDHAHSCSHHPGNFRPVFGFQRSFADWILDKKNPDRLPSIGGLGSALRKYAPTLTICSECLSLVRGDDDEVHADTCSKKKAQLVKGTPSSDLSLFRSSVMAPPASPPANPFLSRCDECGASFGFGGIGHERTCSQYRAIITNPFSRGSSTLQPTQGKSLPVIGSNERCDECKRAIQSDQDHSPLCSKHPSASLGKGRFDDVSFVPFADTKPRSWLQSPLSSLDSCSECGGAVHKLGNVELGHEPWCSQVLGSSA